MHSVKSSAGLGDFGRASIRLNVTPSKSSKWCHLFTLEGSLITDTTHRYIRITCTIVAPTPFLAASFIIFGELIKRLGYQYSRLNPKWCKQHSSELHGKKFDRLINLLVVPDTIIFCTCDVVSLVVQGVGGGIAAAANDRKGTNLVRAKLSALHPNIEQAPMKSRVLTLCSEELRSNC